MSPTDAELGAMLRATIIDSWRAMQVHRKRGSKGFAADAKHRLLLLLDIVSDARWVHRTQKLVDRDEVTT